MVERDDDKVGAAEDGDHASRIHADFDELHDRLGARLDEPGRAAIDRVRDAAAARNGVALRKNLVTLRDEHGWLYRELASHPRLANLIDELALLGL
jgi:hypothetical protein